MKNYDKNLKNTFINYLDASNLYGLAMSKKMPYSNFKWAPSDLVSEMNNIQKSGWKLKEIPP